jgi:hypothetical protein
MFNGWWLGNDPIAENEACFGTLPRCFSIPWHVRGRHPLAVGEDPA